MGDQRMHAVLTGDIVESSGYSAEERRWVLDELKSALGDVDQHWKGIVRAPFEIYRGDSFQGILNEPEKSLHVAIWIRSRLRQLEVSGDGPTIAVSGSSRRASRVRGRATVQEWVVRETAKAGPGKGQARSLRADARLAIGIGAVDAAALVAEGHGQAFSFSGRGLEEMKREERLLVKTPWPDVDDELEVETALLDSLMHRWTPRQAEVVGSLIRDLNRRQIQVAAELGISQSAVAQRASQASWWAVQRICLRFSAIVRMKLDPAGEEQAHQGGSNG